MPDYLRHPTGNRPVFITLVTAKRVPLLLDHMLKFRSALTSVQHRHPFRLPAIVVLPDHCHFIMTLPEGDEDFSTRIGLVKGAFSREVPDASELSESRRKRRERGVWQRRFWEHIIRNEGDFKRHFDYIHYNPVRHGYVKHCREWPFSSFHKYVQRGIYPIDWGSCGQPEGVEIDMAGE